MEPFFWTFLNSCKFEDYVFFFFKFFCSDWNRHQKCVRVFVGGAVVSLCLDSLCVRMKCLSVTQPSSFDGRGDQVEDAVLLFCYLLIPAFGP